MMSEAEQRDYFARRASDVRAMANLAQDAEIRAVLDGMANSYTHLVEQADLVAHHLLSR